MEPNNTVIEEGPPWSTVARFATFDQADKKRWELTEDKELQVKVHYQGTEASPYYAVKTRVDPDLEAAALKKEEKARRKKRLQKKRRKK